MKSERFDWFPCYASKLLGALSGMKPSEGYVYWIVCLRIYEVGGPCRDSLDAIARRTGYNRRVVSEALDACFRSGKLVREGDVIINPFAAEVMAEAKSLIEKRKSAGHAGGLASAEKRQRKQENEPSKRSANAQQKPTHLQEQIHKQIKENNTGAPAPDDWPADFAEQFWTNFPPYRRQSKRKVTEKLERIRATGKVTWATLFGGLLRFSATNPGQYAPAPIVWLNDERWDRVFGNEGATKNETNRNGTNKLGFAGIAARIRYGQTTSGEELNLIEPADPVRQAH